MQIILIVLWIAFCAASGAALELFCINNCVTSNSFGSSLLWLGAAFLSVATFGSLGAFPICYFDL